MNKQATWCKAFPRQMTDSKPRVKYVNHFSKHQKKKNAQYKRIRLEYLAEKKVCEVCHTDPSTAIHHKRGRTGGLLTNTKYFVPVCDGCHRWIHDCPNTARLVGVLAKPGEWGKQ